MTITTPSQQNKFILEKFREEFVLTPQNWRDNPQQYSVSYVSTNATRIESFLLSVLQSKDQEKEKALAEYKAELAETIQKKLTSSVDFLETKGVPYTEGFETALAEVLSLINSQ